MQVGHRFAGIGTIVDHDTKTFFQAQSSGHGARYDEEVTDQSFIRLGSFAKAWYQLFGYNEQMDGRLRLDVVQHDAAVVLELDARGNFSIYDFLKNGFRHGSDGLGLEYAMS